MNKRETHIVQGMTRDLSAHKFSPNMVCDARNIRITPLKNNSTLLAVTNEKGAGRFQVNGSIRGTIIGTAVLNKTLVLFTTTGIPSSDGIDRIYRLDFSDDFKSADSTILFENEAGEESLHFDYEHPLETLPVYENEGIQKVYWVDGKNQPRVINITEGLQENPDVFNFNRKIEGKHSMEVIKYNTGGEFPAGTVQYCFNYFNKFGQETNIVDVSALYYLSPKDKGLPADAVSTSSFVIILEELDTNYEYVRLYSIVRTSENASPNVRIVGDYKISIQLITSREDRASDVITSEDKLYWVSSDLSERILFSDYYTGEWNSETPTSIDIGDGYIYDEATDSYYALYYLSTETPTKISGIVIFKNGTTYNILSNPMPYYSRAGLMVMHKGETKGITVVDNGIVGSTIDATALLFIGGQNIVAGTMTSKDSTLFLGDIKQNVPNIGTLRVGNGILKDSAKETEVLPCIFGYDGKETSGYLSNDGVATEGFYDDPVNNNRSSYDIKSFKARENYRLGFIAQYKTGQWSEVIWLGDYDETLAPGRHVFYSGEGTLGDTFVGWGPSYRKPGFKYTIPQSIVNTLINNEFIRVAPVVVFPKFSERKVLFQGILSGTVFNVNDRYDNSPFAQADWRFRSGYSWENIVGEIQCNPFGYANTLPALYDSMTDDVFVADFSSEYYRDPSILTFFSPDIEALDDLYQSDLDNVGMRIVGISNLGFDSEGKVKLPNTAIDTFLYTKTQGFDAARSTVTDYKQGVQPTIRRRVAGDTLINNRYVEGDTDLSYSGFLDVSVKENSDASQIEGSNNLTKWITYLWHRNGSLNDQPALTAKAVKSGLLRYGLLDKKGISEIKYALTTFFQNGNSPEPFDVDVDINTPKLFDSTQLGMEKFDSGVDSGLFYYGNIDKVVTTNFKDLSGVSITSKYRSTGYDLSNGYPIYYMGTQESSADSDYSTSGRASRRDGLSSGGKSRYADGSTDLASSNKGKDPVSMKYKSTKHLIFGLNAENGTVINQLGTPPEPFTPFWKDALCTFNNVLSGKLEDTLGDFSGIYNSVFIAEIYRKFTPEQESARFGGTTDDAITNNTWIRCGDSQPLEEGSDVTLYFKEGDTYVGRYDCLKSYPFTDEDQNQIVSIYSTEVESRVNLDARYDKNKGLLSNLYMRPTNFNLFNHPGYEQTNQYFTYKALDYARYNFSAFPNLVTWSLEKKMGADIDTWTSISLTSTADVQGDLGEITSLETFNDNIYLFQPRGVAQVLFNERVQIPTSDGQPIEITNGLKYGGLRYLSNQIGMTNKWSLQTTPNGIYFIDDEKNTLYRFEGQGFTDLSSKEGFSTWLFDNNSYKLWNPVDYDNFRTFYDKVNKDIYFINKNEALIYSEIIGHFISFMDYDALPTLVNVNDKLFTFRRNPDNDREEMWEMFAGDYNMFFDYYKPYWLTFISNSNPTYDKIFNNLSWRTESYCNVTEEFKGILQPMSTFDTLRVWNDHQDSGEVSLYGLGGKPSSIKKKFNVFRTFVPRDIKGDWRGKGINRIRNPWTYIQLKARIPNTDMLIFHDLDVDYFI